MAKKSSININDLSTWGLPIVLFVGAIIIFALVFLIKTFLVNDVTTRISSKNSQIAKKEQEYAKNKRIVALLPGIRQEVAELELVRDEAKKYLPTEVSMPSLINNVYLAARDNGIVFDNFTPEKNIETDYYTIKPISLSAEVGYLSMSSFIEQVTTLKRIMNVQSVSFSKANNSKHNNKQQKLTALSDKPLKMTAQLRTYVFKEQKVKEDKK